MFLTFDLPVHVLMECESRRTKELQGRFKELLYTQYGPGSVVGIATGYRLDGQGIESRWGG